MAMMTLTIMMMATTMILRIMRGGQWHHIILGTNQNSSPHHIDSPHNRNQSQNRFWWNLWLFFINICNERKYIVIDLLFLMNIIIFHNPHFIAMGFPFLVCRSVQPWFMLISPDTRLSTGSIQLMMMKKIILILIWCRFHWWLPNTKETYFLCVRVSSPVFRNHHDQDSEFCKNEFFVWLLLDNIESTIILCRSPTEKANQVQIPILGERESK